MPYLTYKTLHLLAVFFVFLALGGLVLAPDRRTLRPRSRRLAAATHGFGLLAVLITGFGLMARLGISHDWRFPLWIWGKMAIWLALGAVLVLLRKRPGSAGLLWLMLPALGGLAAWLALHKPG